MSRRAGIVIPLGGAAVTVIALVLIGTGVWWWRAALVRESPAEPTPRPSSATAAEIPLRGRREPAEFGLPNYPGGVAYHSIVFKREEGSVAFSVRKGSATDILAHYDRALAADGWQGGKRVAARQELGEPGSGRRIATGWRSAWQHPTRHRWLTVLALDLPQRGSSAQALLTWSPTPTSRTRGP